MNCRILTVALTAILATLGASRADDAADGKGKAQTICPVMRGRINKQLYADVQGKRVYVCCKGCIGAIKRNPDRYLKKLADAGVAVAALQTTCPVMGGKINKQLYADVQGKRVYVCCKGCIGAVKQNPDKYLGKLADQGVVVEDVPSAKEQ